MFNKEQVYEASEPKKLVHSKKGWLVCSIALLSMLGLGGYQVSHADTTQTSQPQQSQQTDQNPQSINTTHQNLDEQKGYGDVDNDQNEMKADLNSHNNKSLSLPITDTKQTNEASNNPQATTKYANQTAQSSKVPTYRNDSIHIPSQSQKSATLPKSKANITDRIQQQADQLHSRLINQQIESNKRNSISHHLLGTVQPEYMYGYIPMSDLYGYAGNESVHLNSQSLYPHLRGIYWNDSNPNNQYFETDKIDPHNLSDYDAGLSMYGTPNKLLPTNRIYRDKDGHYWGEYRAYDDSDGIITTPLDPFTYFNCYNSDEHIFNSDLNLIWVEEKTGTPHITNTNVGRLYNLKNRSDVAHIPGNNSSQFTIFIGPSFSSVTGGITSGSYTLYNKFAHTVGGGESVPYNQVYIDPYGTTWIHTRIKINSDYSPTFWLALNNGIYDKNVTIRGFDYNYYTAVSTSKDVPPSILANPSDWQPVNQEAIDAERKTDTINYQYDGQTKGNHQFTGNQSQSVTISNSNDPGLPSGFHLNGNATFRYDGGTHDVAIAPNVVNADVNVTYTNQNGANVGSHSFTVTAAPGSTYNVEPQVSQFLPNGYHLNSFNAIDIHMPNQLGSTLHLDLGMNMTNGHIEDKPVKSVTFALRNQNGQIIGYTRPMHNLGRVGQTVNIEPEIAKAMPEGYSLASYQPIDVKLNGDSLVVLNV